MRSAPGGEIIRAPRLYMRPPEVSDHAAWAELRGASRAFLEPWSPEWTEDELTMAAWRRRLRGYWRGMRDGSMLPLLLFHADSHALLGALTLGNIRRGNVQSANLGYWIGAPHARQGYMTEAVRAAVRHAFAGLRLHRVEAACIPDNIPSRRLLVSCGFREEGLARQYLRINGRWRDHVLYALLREDLSPHP